MSLIEQYDDRKISNRREVRGQGRKCVTVTSDDEEIEVLRRAIQERKNILEEYENQLTTEEGNPLNESSSSSDDNTDLPKLPQRRRPTFAGASLQKFIKKRRKPAKAKDRLSPAVLLNQAKSKYLKARKYFEKKFPPKEAKTLAIEEALMVHESSEISYIVKYCLTAGNAIFLLFYSILLSVCSYVLVEKMKNFSLSHSQMNWILLLDPAVVLLTVSFLFFLLTFLGFFGALRENVSMLRKYQLFLFVLICFVIITLIFLLLYKLLTAIDLVQYLYPHKFFLKAIDLYDDNDDMRDLIDWLQVNFMACGISMSYQGFTDWNNSVYYGCNTDEDNPMRCSVPASCCQGYQVQGQYRPDENLLCGKNALSASASEKYNLKINLQGFGQSFSDMLKDKFTYIMIGLFSLVSPLYIAVTLSEVLEAQICLQLRKYRRNERDFLRKLTKRQTVESETTSYPQTDDYLYHLETTELHKPANKQNRITSIRFHGNQRIYSEPQKSVHLLRSPEKSTQTSDLVPKASVSNNMNIVCEDSKTNSLYG